MTGAEVVRKLEDPKSAAVQPAGADPSNAGPGPTEIQSPDPKDKAGQLNPSAPEDANTTPGSTKPK